MSLGLRLYLDLIAFVFGAVTGSFLNVCIHRVPRGESIVRPPSRCPQCAQPIRWFDNLPLVSWLVLRAKCRHCGAPISARYFLVELLTGILFLLVWLRATAWGGAATHPAYALAAIYWLFIGGLIAASFIDIEHFIIPDGLNYGGLVCGLVLSTVYPRLVGAAVWHQGLLQSMLGVAVGAGCLYLILRLGKLAFGKEKIPLPEGTVLTLTAEKLAFLDEEASWDDLLYRETDRVQFRAATLKLREETRTDVPVTVSKTTLAAGDTHLALSEIGTVEATTDLLVLPREAMGLGDVKLLAAIGAFVGGWLAPLFVVIGSSLVGGLVSLVLVALRHKEWQSRIPYGPYIAIAALIWIYSGPEIVGWYFNWLR
ncbi:prepilin peptidase [bacterium]|nr:prepilin peptidase [bacterium]